NIVLYNRSKLDVGPLENNNDDTSGIIDHWDPDLSVHIYLHRYCLYVLSDLHGKVLYVGKGISGRAFDWIKRFPQLADQRPYTIELYYMRNSEEASRAEIKAIRALTPLLNVTYNSRDPGVTADVRNDVL